MPLVSMQKIDLSIECQEATLPPSGFKEKQMRNWKKKCTSDHLFQVQPRCFPVAPSHAETQRSPSKALALPSQ